jgi:hypothetical protein
MKTKLIALPLLALVSALLFGSPVVAVNFDPGRIIDDAVFTNNTSMTVSQIQNFLNSKVQNCDTSGSQPASDFGRPDLTHAQYAASRGWQAPPYTCLRNYTENGLSSAQIIYNVSQQFKINPQVFIVLLQKETGLVTDTWPLGWQYRTATGYGCPDSTPGVCDASYYGFTNQVTWAGRLFRSVLNQSPGWYSPYIKGWNYIQWSPTSSCGGSMVNVQNWSTAALYDYTPYQPNQAALNAGYGMGDSCSAYGNRNFWLYFNDWFGRTTSGLVRASGDDGIYLIENNHKRAFPSATVFQSWNNKWTDVVQVSPTDLVKIPDGQPMPYNVGYREGRLVSSPTGGVYLVTGGVKRAFPSAEVFLSGGYKWADSLGLSAYELSLIPDGQPMPYNVGYREGRLVSSPTGGVYLVTGGVKRAFPSAEVFLSGGYKWADSLGLSAYELSLIPDGQPMPYNVGYREGRLVSSPTGGVYLVTGGVKRAFPSGLVFTSNSYSWASIMHITDSELMLIPDGVIMTYNLHYRDNKVVSNDGATVYLIDNGTKRAFSSGQAFTSSGYKWSSIVKVSIDELNFIPSGPPVY